MIDPTLPTRPPAPDHYTQKRWDHSSLRRRMLIGDWSEDLNQEMRRHFSSSRRAIIGIEDMSSNIFKSICNNLNALYTESPSVGVIEGVPGEAASFLGANGYISRAGLWPIMQHVAFFTLGLRECFLKIDIHKGELVYIPVTPDFVYASSPPGRPMDPDYIAHLQLRMKKGDPVWTYDIFDLRDLTNPSYKIVEVEKNGDFGEDVSDLFLGAPLEGESYPYRFSDGSPFLPFTLYHAQLLGNKLFDPFYNSELVAGSLTSACLHTFALHMAKNTAYPQRYILGAFLDGASIQDADGTSRRATIPTDPASILVFSPDLEMQGQPMIGQFNAGGDPGALMDMIVSYERKLASSSGGVNPASVQKLSGDPRSGYAIAMSKSDLRASQRTLKPPMEKGDLKTLELSAAMCNRFLGTSFPETGYRIEYQTIPLSKEEMEAIRKDTIEKEQAGYITKIDAVKVFNPDFSDQEAAEYLREVRRQQIEFNVSTI